MIQDLKNKFYNIYIAVISSIAFYPTLIAIGITLIAALLLSFEDNETTKFLIEKTPYLVINNADTARSILSTLIGGIISLTVFSFSMVMILLNQASSNFSPRLLPGLISDKRNQVVLGVYIGTIIYNIIILISILPTGDEYTLNGFSVLVGIVLGVICLCMFVFFIHSISTNIQIGQVLDKIFERGRQRILYLIEQERKEAPPLDTDKGDWYTINNENAGYYQGVNLEGLLTLIEKLKVNIVIEPFKGKYLLPDMALMKIDRKLKKEEIKVLTEYLIISSNNNYTENYLVNIKQISEVGIKAMSPGINDPGTAVITLDYLTELLSLRLQLDEIEVYQSDSKEYRVELKTVDFDSLLFQVLAAYRQYCKHDIILVEKMIMMLRYLQTCNNDNDYYKSIIESELENIKEDFSVSIENKFDREKLEHLLKTGTLFKQSKA